MDKYFLLFYIYPIAFIDLFVWDYSSQFHIHYFILSLQESYNP